MSEGDVSMIQDEDVLRKMWQQTDDFGRKKEIRAHMYRLREERLRNFYSSPDMDVAIATSAAITNRDSAKVGQFSSSTSHTNSFADQCFQSLKSKEVRDSESPTRDYSFKMQDAKDNQSGGWIVQKESQASDDGRVLSQSMKSQISGVKDIDGGKATFAGINEQQARSTAHEDHNSKFRKDEESTKSAKQEHFVKQTDDGSLQTSSSKSSQHFSSKTFQSSTNNADTVDFVHDKTSIVDQDLIGSSKTSRNDIDESLSNKRIVTNNVESSLRNNEIRTIDKGILTSRKIEHPDENTTVITEIRTLPDGTKVTSKSTETKGRTVYSTKSNHEAKAVDQHRDHVESRQNMTNISSSNYDKNINTKKFMDENSRNERVSVKNVTSDFVNEEMKNIASNQHDVNNDILKKVIDISKGSTEQIYNIQNSSQKSDIKLHQDVQKDFTKTKERSNIDDQHRAKEVDEVQQGKTIDESKIPIKPTDYTTTYQSDYTQKRISTDLSPTHQAWASTLRSDSPVPERKSPSRSSLRTSQSSLRSSQSPDKTITRKNHSDRPDKVDRSSPFRASSIDKDSVTRNTSETYRSSTERHITKSRFDQKRDTIDKQSSPDRFSNSPERIRNKHTVSVYPQKNRESSPAPSNYSTDTYTYDTYDKKTFDHKPSNQSKYSKSPNSSPDRILKKPNEKSTDNEHSDKTQVIKDKSSMTSKYSRDGKTLVSNQDQIINKQIKTKSPERTQRFKSPSPGQNQKETSQHKSPERTHHYSSPYSDKYSKESKLLKDRTETTHEKSDTISKVRNSSPTLSNYSTSTYTHEDVTKETSNKMTDRVRNKSPTIGSQKISQYDDITTENDNTSTVMDTDRSRRITNLKDSFDVPSENSLRSKPTSNTQSRDSSPTTSVSEIEYISTHKNVHLVTDLDELESKTNITNQKTMTDIQTKSPVTSRSQSPMKSSISDRQDSIQNLNTPTDQIKRPKERPPFVRSETYEERCRKILGMPDKKTLVMDAEKTLSEILSILPQNNLNSSDSSSASPYSISPERDVTPKLHDLPKKILSEYPAQRKSPSPDRRVRILDTVDFITTEKAKYEENRYINTNETVNLNEVIGKEFSRQFPSKERLYNVSPNTSRSPSPEKINEDRKKKLVSLTNIDKTSHETSTEVKYGKNEAVNVKKHTDKSPTRKLQDKIGNKSPYISRSPSPEKLTKSAKDTSITQTTDITTTRRTKIERSPSPQKSPIRNVSPEPRTKEVKKSITQNKIMSYKPSSPERHLPKDETHRKSPYSSRSPSPEKLTKSITRMTDKTTRRTTNERSPSPHKSPIRHASPESQRSQVIKTVTENITQKNRSLSPDKHLPKDKVHNKSPYTSRSPSPGKVTKSVKETSVTKTTDITTTHKTTIERSPSPQKSSRHSSPESGKRIATKSVTQSKTQNYVKHSSPERHSPNTKKSLDSSETTDIITSSKASPPKRVQKETEYVLSKNTSTKHQNSVINESKVPSKQRPASPSKTPTKKPLTEYPAQRKPSSDNLKVDKQKIESAKTETRTSKSTHVTHHKTHKQTGNRITNSSTSEKVVVDSSSDTEQERFTRRKSIDKSKHHSNIKSATSSPSRPINDHNSKVFNGDVKITRTTSDLTMKTHHKNFPVRNKSKPEINVTRTSSSRSMNKEVTTTSTSKFDTKQFIKSETIKTQSPTNLTTKPKSATTLNTSDEDNIIIDIQHAKSSRENSPDKLCPLPVGLNEETGKPRFPDQVSEPDDEKPKSSNINTIHETDSVGSFSDSKIVELSDVEYNQDIRDVHNTFTTKTRPTNEDYLLSVNQKVSKFLIDSEKTNNKYSTESDSVKLKVNAASLDEHKDIDESLLSVSDKVSKFLAAADKSKMDKSSDRSHITDDHYKINISDKASVFSKTKESESDVADQKPKNRDKNLKDVSHQKMTTTSELQTASKTIDEVRNKFESVDVRRGSITKETISSQAKVFDSKSPNLKNSTVLEKSSPKITSLRSNEAVKKAKALFENIGSLPTDSKPKDSKGGAKLTDIGVFNTSKEAVNEEIDVKSTVTDSEIGIEIDIGPNIKSDKIQFSKGTYNRPGNHPGNYPKSQQPRSPDRNLPNTTNYTTRKSENTTVDKSVSSNTVLSRFPQGQRTKSPETKKDLFGKSKAVDASPVVTKPVTTVKHETREIEVDETREISSRRGSGKFGVELRRTSADWTPVERRRSSTTEPHLQPCIEDIRDLALLEQMLEKVAGYEQRRRIRAQIRLVKKSKDDKLHTLTTDKSSFVKHHTDTKHVTNVKNISQNILNSERSATTRETVTLDDRKRNVAANVRTYSPDRLSKKPDQHIDKRKSPDKKSTNVVHKSGARIGKEADSVSPNRTRKHSPDKRPRPASPSKTSPSNKITSSKYNEYTTAYMRKIGLDLDSPNAKKSRKSPVKTITDKVTKTDMYDVQNKIGIERSSITSSSERRSSKTEVEVTQRNGVRSPSPDNKRKMRESDKLYRRSPSPDLKRPRDASQKTTDIHSNFTSWKSKSTTSDLMNGSHKQKTDEDKPIWATTNVLRKTDTSEPRKFTPKKMGNDKIVRRAQSPSKTVVGTTDLITSSYGVGPTDENGKPLFGIRALRHQNGTKNISNYEVKGTVIKKEFHSRNGGEPEGEISITAYSSNPEDLTRFLENNNASKTAEEIKHTLHEKEDSRRGITSITTTKKFGNRTGNSMSKIHTERAAIMHTPETLAEHDRKVVRRGSVKSLTEKFIKNAVETTKTEKDSYPKAGLILRSGRRSSGSLSSGSSTNDILACTENNASVDSEETSVFHTRTETTNISSSFLDSNTKVTGVQDILTRMKNADIVIQEGDTNEDAEARALLNKFLGASCLMTGMESYVTQKPQSRQQETKTRTFSKVTSSSAKDIDLSSVWDERVLRGLLDECADYERRRLIRARLRQVMAEQEACAQIVADAVRGEPSTPTSPTATTVVKQSSQEKEKSTKVEGSTVKTVTSEKTTNVTTTKETKVSESSSQQVKKPVSPFAKFKQLEKQNSTPTSPSSPKTPLTPGGTQPLFRFTDPQLQASAATIKERLLQWCRDKTKEYENVKLDNFSTSWSDGLAFCALIHHFLPDAYDYAQLTAEKRRHNFTLAFKVADEKAGIFPLLDVDDMVTMRKPDWKCVFTYVQAIHRRFKDQD